MKLLYIGLMASCLSFLCVKSSLAESEDYYAIAMQAQANSTRLTEQYKKEIPEFTRNQEKLTSLYKSEAKTIEMKSVEQLQADYAHKSTESIEKPPTSNILIFVSFSMPENSIKRIISDASKIHADVVIRGLINNSFKETMLKMNELVKSSGGGVELNPIWFKRFKIDKVPAYVVVPETSRCMKADICNSADDYDVIYGDMSLESALEEISNKGSVGISVSTESLKKLRGSVDA